MFTDESFEKKAESPARMSQEDLLEFFNSLKPKEEVLIWYDSGIRRADDWTPMTVGRRSESKKYNLKKVSLTGKHGGKFILYNRQGKISLAMGGMATVLVAAKKNGSFGAETFEATDVGKRMKCRGCNQWEHIRGVAMNDFFQDDKGKWRCYNCLYDKPNHKVVVIGRGKHKPFAMAENFGAEYSKCDECGSMEQGKLANRCDWCEMDMCKDCADAHFEDVMVRGVCPDSLNGIIQDNQHISYQRKKAETFGVEESCMICSNPPVLRTQWGHTVCGDDDCRIKAMNMIRRENVICDCGKTMKPVGDGYYECNACYDNKYIGDVEFGAETFEATKGIDTFTEPFEDIGISKPYARLGVIAAGITALAFGVKKLRK